MISPLAVVESDEIGTGVTVGEFAIVRRGARIDDNVVVHPHSIIESGVVVGEGAEIFPGAYIGKEPKTTGALARPLTFQKRVSIGRWVHVGPHAVIYYDVEIGDLSLIGDGASIREQSRIGSSCVIGRNCTINYAVVIGNRVKVMDLTWLAGNMTIGNDVFISGGVLTANDNSFDRFGYDGTSVVGPQIKDGAMIGVGATLLPAVVIHEKAIVGAGSVVTRDVAAHTLVNGIPARFVRMLVTDS